MKTVIRKTVVFTMAWLTGRRETVVFTMNLAPPDANIVVFTMDLAPPDTNAVVFITPDGSIEELPLQTKQEVAGNILDRIKKLRLTR